MTITAGIDVGSTYTKAVLLDERDQVLASVMKNTGFKLAEVAETALDECLTAAKLPREAVDYVVSTGYGRHQVASRDLQATELTAAARSARRMYPDARTLLDIGGQTMKASRIDGDGKVVAFRLNDKCAAGTGAFLEKTARYMGYETEAIAGLLETSRSPVPISGVCAVFAESEVINHLSLGTPPADIMQGAIESLVGRAMQLIKRVRPEPDYVLIGGILRFETLVNELRERLEGKTVHVPDESMVQFMAARGAAILGHHRLAKLRKESRASQHQLQSASAV
jgi:predicted CoA-substrate-specific enzyme activase